MNNASLAFDRLAIKWFLFMIRCAGDLNALTAGRVCAYGYIDGGGGFPLRALLSITFRVLTGRGGAESKQSIFSTGAGRDRMSKLIVDVMYV